MRATERVVHSADDTSIGFRQLGSGPAVVFVHGAWANGAVWLDVAGRIADHYTCYVMDRRGRDSSSDGSDYSMTREVEDIEAVLDTAGQGASLLGHSSGAIYALEAARRRPLDRLILYEPPIHFFHDPDARAFVDRIRECVDEGRPEEAVSIFFREEAGLGEDQLAFLRSQPVWRQMASRAWTCVREWDALFESDLRIEQYRSVTTPTLLLAGTENRQHPSFATKALERTLPDSRTAMLEGQGHMAHQSAPDLISKELLAFLGDKS